MRQLIAPHRVRRRLAVAFTLVVLLSTGAPAAGSFIVVRETRRQDSVDRSLRQTHLNTALAAGNLPPKATVRRLRDLLSSYEGAGFETVIVSNDVTVKSSFSIDEQQVPENLARLVGAGNLAYQRTPVAGVPYLVTGSPIPGPGVDAYFFFSEEQLNADLRQLGTILLLGTLVSAAIAATIGNRLARGVLGPVARANEAARSLAEGLLSTRLDIEADDEFGSWAASFNEMASALEAKISALSDARERERRFTADVSHELRTPVTAFVGEASLLRDNIAHIPAVARRPAELLISDVQRLRRLVEDLIEISRLDAGREIVATELVELSSLVTAVLVSRSSVEAVRTNTTTVVVESDRRRLERIVANLIDNAFQHGQATISVTVGRETTDAFIEVADEGPGIAPEHLPHLFERFYKVDAARSGAGSGLGLAIAWESASLLGAQLSVRSISDKGSAFTLRIPVTTSLPDEDGSVSFGRDAEAVTHDRVRMPE